MSQQAATITSLPMAFEVVKAMQAEGLDWDESYRPLGRKALEGITEAQMAAAVERYLEQLEADDADRRNGSYSRHLLTELGEDQRPVRPVEAGVQLALIGAEPDGDPAGSDARRVGDDFAVECGDDAWPNRLQPLDQHFPGNPFPGPSPARQRHGLVITRHWGCAKI